MESTVDTPAAPPTYAPLPTRRAFVLGGLMAATAGASVLAMPKLQITSDAQMPNLDKLVPEEFGHWRLDRNTVPLQVSPEVAEMLNTIYDRTLSRTFMNPQGERMMLSIAYGANQSRALQLHKPEVCYAAQGFRIGDLHKADWQLTGVSIPTMHLVGVLGPRVEPVTYWMRVGDEIARGWYEQNVARLRYGMRGLIPDGVLFRISNISREPKAAFELQRAFVDELFQAFSPEARRLFVGATTLSRSAAGAG